MTPQLRQYKVGGHLPLRMGGVAVRKEQHGESKSNSIHGQCNWGSIDNRVGGIDSGVPARTRGKPAQHGRALARKWNAPRTTHTIMDSVLWLYRPERVLVSL